MVTQRLHAVIIAPPLRALKSHRDMSADTVSRLPAIKSSHSPAEYTDRETPLSGNGTKTREDEAARLNKASSYIGRIRLGSVLYRQPRPGDVYRPRTTAGLGRFSTARPLGKFYLAITI